MAAPRERESSDSAHTASAERIHAGAAPQDPRPRVVPGGPAPRAGADLGRVFRLASVLATWSLAYAGYRAYYAAGGGWGMIGRPVSQSQFETVNAVGAGIIVAFAVVMPLLLVSTSPLRRLAPAVGWVGAVGCCMHAFVDATLRLFSVTGVHPTELPADFWVSFDRHAADVQDLLLNEPWFFIEGLLWSALALSLVPARHARRWLISAIVVCLLLSTFGVLRGLDLVGPTPFG